MLIANNATPMLFVTDYNKQNSRLQTSMAKLSSGQRMVLPGEAPADLGISERFRNQIRSSREADRVIQNAINMFTSSDGWLQQVNDILNRMSELAISASDGSKNQQDRKNLDLEFQQLKQEISRISEAGKYNGLQINSSQYTAVYDTVEQTVVYSQADGTVARELDLELGAGNSGTNGVDYNFESANGNFNNFTFTADGKNLIYISAGDGDGHSAMQSIAKIELATGNVSVGSGTANAMTAQSSSAVDESAEFVTDDQGRLWVSDYMGGARFQLKLMDVEAMTLDSGGGAATNSWAGTGTSLVRGEFAISGDFAYYFDFDGTTNNFVKQSLFDQADMQVLISDVEGTTGPFGPSGLEIDEDQISVSGDGRYIAWVENDQNEGTINIVDTVTQETASMSAGVDNDGTIRAMEFGRNNQLYWTDTGTANKNALRRAEIVFGDPPEITNVRTLRQDNLGHMGSASGAASTGRGLAIGTGSPASNYLFQVGPDSGQLANYATANISLVDLGISTSDVLTIANAQKAIASVASAVDEVTNQRAVVGSEVSRLNFTLAANITYGDNISQAESRIRDVDFATESSNLASAQIMAQASASILSQANAARGVVLQLLQ